MSSIIKVNTVQDQDGNNIINENANTITIGASGDTISIPAGATLANSGTATGFASIAWQSSIVTAATITVESGKGYWLDTSSNAITVTLPAAPAVGDQIILTDYARNWATNAVTINQNSKKFQGNTSPNPVYNTAGQSVDIVFSGTTQGWIPNSDDDVSFETPQTYSVDFLVVAGGGGSGASQSGSGSGGGGAGGFRTASSISFTGGQVYTVTVGAGGSGGAGTSAANDGGQGGSSSISGSGITTITSAGGGGGSAADGTNGLAGGSGGGAGGSPSAPTGQVGGAGNTPSTTPSQGNNGGTVTSGSGYGAGGGGAGGAAPNGGSSPASGGAGTANSITGASVTYAAGGGAGNNNPGAVGAANTGNGGVGSGQNYAGSAGGTGVVILSVPDGNYSGTTTGSPTVTTGVSGKTIIKFTGDGSYTA